MRLLLAALTLFMGLAACAPGMARAPGDEVPQSHWAYDAVQSLAQDGFHTGFPDGTFSGKRLLRRNEFSRALRCLVGELQRANETNTRRWTHPSDQRCFRKLVREFSPDLLAEGVQVSDLATAYNTASEYFGKRGDLTIRDWTPQEFSLLPLWPPDKTAQTAGTARAAAEWRRGEIVLELGERPCDLGIPLPNALPIRTVPQALTSERVRIEVNSHNEWLWKQLRKSGPPPGSALSWLKLALHQDERWNGSAKEHGQSLVRECIAPDGKLRLKWGYPPDGWPDLLLFTPRGSRSVSATGLPVGYSQYEYRDLLWGPEGAGIAFFRERGDKSSSLPPRYYVVDLRSGVILNVEGQTNGERPSHLWFGLI